MKVSERLHNDTYAPGIPTYGIKGKTGDQGEPGVSLFFTDYTIDEIEEHGEENKFKAFAEKITSRKLPLIHYDIVLDRNYTDGDQFVMRNGKVYRLKNIVELSKAVATGFNMHSMTLNIDTFLEHIGNFDKEDSIFNEDNNQHKSKYLILSDNPEGNNPSSGLLTLNRKNNINGYVSFINMNALYKSMPNINLDIRYDNTLSAFVFKSDYPIIFDANTYFKMDADINKTLYGYSPVVYKDNTITNFYGTCKKLQYDLDASVYSYTKKDSSTIYFGCIYMINIQTDPYENILDNYVTTNSSIIIHFQNEQYQDFQVYRPHELTYYFKEEYDEVHMNKLLNDLQVFYMKNIQVSLIDNVEVYLHKNNINIIGYKININP